jgi:hypothetical protein
MEIRSIFVLVGLLAASAAVADAYKWIDEDGVVTYSDRQKPGAEQIDLSTNRPPSTPYNPGSARPTARTDDQEQEAEKPFRYESLSVSSPSPEVTLWDIAGVLDVSVALTPSLQSNHQVRVILDGAEPQAVGGQNFQLQEIWRGVHNIQVEVLDQTGKVMIRSAPNRFYVQQNVVR